MVLLKVMYLSSFTQERKMHRAKAISPIEDLIWETSLSPFYGNL